MKTAKSAFEDCRHRLEEALISLTRLWGLSVLASCIILTSGWGTAAEIIKAPGSALDRGPSDREYQDLLPIHPNHSRPKEGNERGEILPRERNSKMPERNNPKAIMHEAPLLKSAEPLPRIRVKGVKIPSEARAPESSGNSKPAMFTGQHEVVHPPGSMASVPPGLNNLDGLKLDPRPKMHSREPTLATLGGQNFSNHRGAASIGGPNAARLKPLR